MKRIVIIGFLIAAAMAGVHVSASAAVTATFSIVGPNPYTGPCPVNINFSGTISGPAGTPVTYRFANFVNAAWVYGNPVNATIPASGTLTIAETLNTDKAHNGFQSNQVDVTAPNAAQGKVYYTVNCQAGTTTTPGVSDVGYERSNIASIIAASLKPAAPVNLRSVNGGTDCGAHVGPLGALVCPAMMAAGDLLLIWDWQAGAGPDEIDGYRVYRVDSGMKQLVFTRTEKKDLTLVDVPKPASGSYTGRCYAVSAYAGAHESNLSPAFCAAGGSVAQTTRLSAEHMRSSHEARNEHGVAIQEYDPLAYPGLVVGFYHDHEKRVFGDIVHNLIYRSAFEFDVSRFAGHRLVTAKLFLNLQRSERQGNNHSCATDVGTGTEFWWLNNNWIEGQFGLDVTPTDVGPLISADVMQFVEPWLRGAPNYGFVLKGGAEDLGAFDNNVCQTEYSNPVLELTYY